MSKKILLFLIILMPFSVNAQWSFVGPQGISSGWSTYNKLVVDTAGAPIIAFVENATGHCLRFDGAQWAPVGASTFNFPVSSILKLLIDSNNNIYLFFPGYNSYLSCIRYDGVSWNYAGGQHIVQDWVNHFTASFDKNGVLYCAYNTTTGTEIKFLSDSTWEAFSTAGTPSSMVFMSLVFDADNNPCLAYQDLNLFTANCLLFNGTSWEALGNSNFYNGFTQDMIICATPQNDLFVSFNINNAGYCMKLNRQSGTWEMISTGFLYGINDMITDWNGSLYVTALLPTDNKARCFKFDGGWEQLDSSGISEAEAGYVTLALNPAGTLYASYNDWNTGKAVVKQYPNAVSIQEHLPGIIFSVYPNPAVSDLTLQLPAGDGRYYVKVINNMGSIVMEKHISTLSANVINISLGSLSSGVYYISVENGQASGRRMFVKCDL